MGTNAAAPEPPVPAQNDGQFSPFFFRERATCLHGRKQPHGLESSGPRHAVAHEPSHAVKTKTATYMLPPFIIRLSFPPIQLVRPGLERCFVRSATGDAEWACPYARGRGYLTIGKHVGMRCGLSCTSG